MFADHLLWKELFSGFVFSYPRFPFMWNVATIKPQEKLVQSILFWMIVNLGISYENKHFRPVRELNPSPLRYRCSALPTGSSSFCWFVFNPWSDFITAFPSDQLFNQFSEKTESGVIVNNNSLKKPIGRQSANSAPTVSRQVFLWSCSTWYYPLSSRRAREYVSTETIQTSMSSAIITHFLSKEVESSFRLSLFLSFTLWGEGQWDVVKQFANVWNFCVLKKRSNFWNSTSYSCQDTDLIQLYRI